MMMMMMICTKDSLLRQCRTPCAFTAILAVIALVLSDAISIEPVISKPNALIQKAHVVSSSSTTTPTTSITALPTGTAIRPPPPPLPLVDDDIHTSPKSVSSPLSLPVPPSPRTYMKKGICIKTPDPIPEQAHDDVYQLLQSGRLYRYGAGANPTDSFVSRCELEIASFTKHKYCIAVNSCGSALMLLLKTTNVQHGDKVISNAFTFGAVPSAIHHVGAIPIYVESTMDMIIDVSDLEQKLIAHPDCRHVLISHMRGKVADMASIVQLCQKYNVVLLEDCAHSLGVMYDHQHTGHAGVACAISSQSYKMINSGEGGFVLTNDPDIAAQTAVYAGAYESLSTKHITVPPLEYFQNYPKSLPNYSLRMSELTAAIIRPQIHTLDERIRTYERRYTQLVQQLEQRVGPDYMTIPKLTPEVTQMVHDSLQFHFDTKFTSAMMDEFLLECQHYGLMIELFGHVHNARNYINWQFAPSSITMSPLPHTSQMLQRACDVRLPYMWNDSDFDDMANVIIECIHSIVQKHELQLK